ncbi:hypothetical protein [Serratia aquatilis]|uniref:Uncharacterized protein n=1 Tax=Serratia aquatilis TaxID=1737515 RepID=A0ABV6EG40_9GAMM
MHVKTLITPILLPALFVGMVQAEPLIESREYKILLDPAHFSGGKDQAKNQTENFLNDFNTELKKQGLADTVKKEFKADKVRLVSFYDTPGTCKLKADNYVVRERIQVKSSKREIMMKRRTNTLAELEGVTLAGASPDSSSKVETDIVPGKVVYSISTKQTVGTEPLDSIESLDKLFPDLELNFKQTGALAKVSNLSIIEHSFEGPELKLDGQSFKFDLSIWYVTDETKPVIVELSYKITEPTGKFSAESLSGAEKIMSTISDMNKWAAPESMMKTNWVYQYQPGFCK